MNQIISGVFDTIHRVAHDKAHGGTPVLATRMGVKSGVLNSKLNPNCNTHHLRLDEMLQIIVFLNDDQIMQSIAHQLGGTFCRVDSTATDGDLLMTALSVSASNGDISSIFRQAMADGIIDSNERKQLQETIATAMSNLQKMSVELDNHCGESQ